MRGDTVEQAVRELRAEDDELGVALPDGIEQMLQGQDLADYIALRQAEERKSWLYRRGLTEDDVYGRHADPRPIDPNDTLARMTVVPKGMEFSELRNGGQVIRTDARRAHNYVGEHRRPKNTTTYPDGMTYLCGRSLFRVNTALSEFADELIAWVDDNDEADVYGGYVNQ